MDHILIIEDDLDVLENLKDILEYYGYLVSTATNGLEGYDLAVEYYPDLIICDINMPELNGFELLDMLKRNPETYTIPFLFLTAMTDKAYYRKGMNLGADDYITKPYENKDIINAVQSKIDKYSDMRLKFTRNLEFMKSRITTSIPNHFVEPINSILGFTSVLKNNFDNFDDTEKISIIENIFDSGDIMLRMLDNYGLYLKLSNTSYLDLDITEDDYPVDKIISDILEIEGLHFGVLNSIRVHLESAILLMNSFYIKKIVLEFINVASRLYDEDYAIFIKGFINEEMYELSIEFNSRGLSAALINSIGDLDNSSLKDIDSKNCSVSLSLLKLIAEIHKGKMIITSNPYDKTTICLQIPINAVL